VSKQRHFHPCKKLNVKMYRPAATGLFKLNYVAFLSAYYLSMQSRPAFFCMHVFNVCKSLVRLDVVAPADYMCQLSSPVRMCSHRTILLPPLPPTRSDPSNSTSTAPPSPPSSSFDDVSKVGLVSLALTNCQSQCSLLFDACSVCDIQCYMKRCSFALPDSGIARDSLCWYYPEAIIRVLSSNLASFSSSFRYLQAHLSQVSAMP